MLAGSTAALSAQSSSYYGGGGGGGQGRENLNNPKPGEFEAYLTGVNSSNKNSNINSRAESFVGGFETEPQQQQNPLILGRNASGIKSL